jgi:hypothetical protein
MKHIRSEQWIDFVNQLITGEQMEPIRTHLDRGCRGCEAKLEIWRNIRGFATRELAYQPPEHAIRRIKDLLHRTIGTTRRSETNDSVELLFDSFMLPALAGVRAVKTGVRRLLFRAGGFQVELEIEPMAARNIALTGQLTPALTPDFRSFHVIARDGQGHSVHTASTETGEFYLETQNSRDLELTLLGGARLIVISLGDPLKDSPRERR